MKSSIFYVKHSPAITFPRHAPLIRPSCRARSRHVPTCAECRNTKKGTHLRCVPKGGDYLLFRFRSTIGVIRFNFSVRNGKRWSPYAVFALISFQKRTRPEAEKTLKHSSFTSAPLKAFAFYGTFGQLVPLGYARHHACTCGLSTSSSATALGMRPNLGAGFVLRCFQHLSCPDAATRLCPWRDNRCTGGPSGTVLSY